MAFVHPLLREAVYRDLPAAEQELCHERAAAVSARPAPPASSSPLTCCWRRRGPTRPVAVLEAAARTAASRGASEAR